MNLGTAFLKQLNLAQSSVKQSFQVSWGVLKSRKGDILSICSD